MFKAGNTPYFGSSNLFMVRIEGAGVLGSVAWYYKHPELAFYKKSVHLQILPHFDWRCAYGSCLLLHHFGSY